VQANSRIRCEGGVNSFISRMRKSSVRCMVVLRKGRRVLKERAENAKTA
jgi:hypothetical protein